ncbi:DNA polymerase III subunit gamma/tau [Sporolactobacillus laevolacticus]|uniref:DNA polymerase III subunit gamma/tau n=1 Tax=Sporolactobacillus laevolacticus TaxID=33018 RepID=UPI0025B2D9EE|nr:DNA polymerase III subunit gamma/tau [Sporolactobacillus laevolacticus]MDN3956164.1 DNA polymerase III subunit gamma/tau [Sporolactobacillus laevolacticus]
MFNNKFKKESVATYKATYKEYEVIQKEIVKCSETLFNERLSLKKVIESTLDFVNKIRNKPLEMETKVNVIQIEYKKFENTVLEIEIEVEKALKENALGAGAGVAAGAGIAAFGPTAAMAIATTFGTASTGAAISTLSGAAAANAALAWLGGGALVAGGGGMAAGSTFLTLAGPIGWTIGGGAIITAGILSNSKNKKAGNEALEKAKEIRKAIRTLEGTKEEILETNKLTYETRLLLKTSSETLSEYVKQYDYDFKKIVDSNNGLLLKDLGTLVNNMKSAVQLINRPIGAKA